MAAPILLIHGAWHGAWCWAELCAALHERGVEAAAIDLPGCGCDRTPAEVVDLALWGRRIAQALSNFDRPAVLLGHAMGGMAITQAAELAPERIRRLVYLCAFLPADGLSLADLQERSQAASPHLRKVPVCDGRLIGLVADSLRPCFYHDCDDAAFALAQSRVRSMPAHLFDQPVRISPERAGRVPRVYIECTEDRVLPIAAQRRMAGWAQPIEVASLAAGHSPFLSMPGRLADLLAGLAA